MSYMNSSNLEKEMYEMIENWNYPSQEKRVAKGLLLMKARGCKLDGLLESDLKRGIVKVIPK
jgi:hypothetical protein